MEKMIIELSFAQAYVIFKVAAWGIGGAGLLFGVFSIIAPAQSIKLYQWIMKGINWSVTPIDMALEIRSTRRLSMWLILLSLTLAANLYFKFCS